MDSMAITAWHPDWTYIHALIDHFRPAFAFFYVIVALDPYVTGTISAAR